MLLFWLKKIGSVNRCALPEVLFCQRCPGKFLVQNRCIQQSGINKQQCQINNEQITLRVKKNVSKPAY